MKEFRFSMSVEKGSRKDRRNLNLMVDLFSIVWPHYQELPQSHLSYGCYLFLRNLCYSTTPPHNSGLDSWFFSPPQPRQFTYNTHPLGQPNDSFIFLHNYHFPVFSSIKWGVEICMTQNSSSLLICLGLHALTNCCWWWVSRVDVSVSKSVLSSHTAKIKEIIHRLNQDKARWHFRRSLFMNKIISKVRWLSLLAIILTIHVH